MFSVKDLSFRYPRNPDETLRGLSFEIDSGEVFGFLGPSGSGKSTTQKILYKLLTGYSGEVEVAGKNLRNWGRELFERIGVCFELPNHYLKLTGRENLRFFAAFYPNKKDRTDELLELVGLSPDANKRLSEYSKGMKMRLNFARALLHDPEILFLDEPTTGLDPVTARGIKDAIVAEKAKGKTIFLTTHNMFDADQLCDRVALIHDGRIVEMDRPDVLKLRHGSPTVKVTTVGSAEARGFPMEDIGHNEKFLELLKSQEVETIHSDEATLEEVFIKLTGEQLL